MANTTTISCEKTTKAKLEEIRRKSETWNKLLIRLADETRVKNDNKSI